MDLSQVAKSVFALMQRDDRPWIARDIATELMWNTQRVKTGLVHLRKIGMINVDGLVSGGSHGGTVFQYRITDKGRATAPHSILAPPSVNDSTADLPLLAARSEGERQTQPDFAVAIAETFTRGGTMPFDIVDVDVSVNPHPLIRIGQYRIGVDHVIFIDESSNDMITVSLNLTEYDDRTNRRINKTLRFSGDEARQLRAALDVVTVAPNGQSDEISRLREELAAAEQLASETEQRAVRAESELKTMRERLRSFIG